jgi:hypothetical protein
LATERLYAAPGQEDTLLVINNAGHDRGLGEKCKIFSLFASRVCYPRASLCIAAMRRRNAFNLIKPSASA